MISDLSTGGASVPASRDLGGASVPASRDLSFAIDDATAEFFARRVPDTEQKRVRRLLAVLREIHESGRGRQNPTIQRLSEALQMPFGTLRRLYYDYKLGCHKAQHCFAPGDWRCLLNWSKIKSEQTKLPFAFLEFWRGLGEKNQRKWKPAHDELLQILRTGRDFSGREISRIPGFQTFPQIDPVLGHPPGMSYGHLMRHASSAYDQAAARIGRVAASRLRIPVLKSRVGLRLGQFMEFDDHEFNQKLLFGKKPMRALAFGAVEVLSDCLFQIGFKPTLWDEAEEMKRKLTEREFLWFLLAVLCGTGYRRDDVGTTLVMERGTTTVREPYLSRLQAVLGAGVKFYLGSNAGNHSRAAHAGQFSGQPKGNFRTKAIVESKWNAVDNQTASLLGQVGKDRDHAPAQLYGAEKYTGQIIRAAEERNVSLDLVRLPFHSFAEWSQRAHEAIQRINEARDHACEGWEKLGFVRKLWRAEAGSPFWHTEADFAALSEIDRAVIKARLTSPAGAELIKLERAHRREVFNQFRHELQRLPLSRIPEIVGPEFALRAGNGGEQLLTVRKGLLSFDCAEMDSDTLHFYARDEQAAPGQFVPDGRKFLCFVNPYLPTHLIACDEKLRVQAICPRYVPATDAASLERNLGAQAAMEAAQRVRLNLRHDDESVRKIEMKAHNEIVLRREQPVTAAEIASAERVAADGPDAAESILAATATVGRAESPDTNDFLSAISARESNE